LSTKFPHLRVSAEIKEPGKAQFFVAFSGCVPWIPGRRWAL